MLQICVALAGAAPRGGKRKALRASYLFQPPQVEGRVGRSWQANATNVAQNTRSAARQPALCQRVRGQRRRSRPMCPPCHLCCHSRKVVRPHHSTPLAAAGSSLAARCSFAVRRLLCARSLLAARCSLASLAARRCSLCAPAVRCSLCVLAALAGPRLARRLVAVAGCPLALCCCWLLAPTRAHTDARLPPSTRAHHARTCIHLSGARFLVLHHARTWAARQHPHVARAGTLNWLS